MLYNFYRNGPFRASHAGESTLTGSISRLQIRNVFQRISLFVGELVQLISTGDNLNGITSAYTGMALRGDGDAIVFRKIAN